MQVNAFPHVFAPLTVRGLILKNRLQYAPTVVLKCSPQGEITQEMLDYMAWQAGTGVAYVTLGDTPVVHDDTSAFTCEMNVTTDDCIHGMERLAQTARQNGSEISVELAHSGRGSRTTPGGPPALAPSASRPLDADHGNLKEMTLADMEETKNHYVQCAVRCKKAGFRMVMIHCGHGNLLAQFLSPDSNARTDAYGGSGEHRRRYPLEVLAAVRQAVGEDMVIEIRVSGSERVPGGYDLAESLDFMEAAQAYADIIHVSSGVIFNHGGIFTAPTYFRTPQFNVEFAAAAKQRLHVPVCVVGMIGSLAEAEEIIASGKADLVAMAKAFMADGDMVKKTLLGASDRVRPCTRCDLCGNANMYGTSMRCAINPRLGQVGALAPLPEEKRKKLMVIGGGPGGMMAAQTAAALGHTVTLYEKADRLGGLLWDATRLPFKGYMARYLAWDIAETLSSAATVKLGVAVTAETVAAENPDGVIVATGSVYLTPPIPGMERAMPVYQADGGEVVGREVVVCGGGLSGVECALGLAREGKSVTVLDQIPAASFCATMPRFNRADLFQQLEELGVNLVGGVTITAITADGVTATDGQGNVRQFPCHTAVNALGVKPDNGLGLELLAQYGSHQVCLIGDCVARGRNYGDANREGYNAALLFSK